MGFLVSISKLINICFCFAMLPFLRGCLIFVLVLKKLCTFTSRISPHYKRLVRIITLNYYFILYTSIILCYNKWYLIYSATDNKILICKFKTLFDILSHQEAVEQNENLFFCLFTCLFMVWFILILYCNYEYFWLLMIWI